LLFSMESTQPHLCRVKPQALFQIVDYFERRSSMLQNDDRVPARVIGTLLGSIDGGVVTVTNCYKVPHKEQVRGGVEEVAINMEFNENLFRLHKKVAPQEIIVGWFTTSKQI